MPVLTPELKQRWDTDGWCIVPEVIPPDELAAAQDAMHHHFPTPAEMAVMMTLATPHEAAVATAFALPMLTARPAAFAQVIENTHFYS